MSIRFTTTHRRRRHAFRAVAVGVTLSLSPVTIAGSSVYADSTASSVTGLSEGSRGEGVRRVQQALAAKGVSMTVDGVFGSGTAAGLKTFQRWNGLNPTGRVDAATELALGLSSSPFLGLKQGSRGDSVRSLQQKLQGAGLNVAGGPDGIFGPGTAAALKAFQSSKGYAPTGAVNAATAVALGSTTAVATQPAQTTAAPAAASTSSSSTSSASTAKPPSLIGLKIGSSGLPVTLLQQQLIVAGFKVVGGADGRFGVLTANALSSFQYSQGLKGNAIVSETTAIKLAKAASAKQGSSGATHSPAASTSTVGLARGTAGDKVRQLQQSLLDAGVKVRGGADGIFGPATESALKAYQAAQGLSQSGRVDDATAKALASGKAVAGSAPVSAMLGLKAGSLGPSVKQLQQSMLDAGVKVRGGADGIFGPATANALKEFQTSQGLSATGVVDEATASALKSPKAAVQTAAGTGGFAAYGETGQRVIALQSAIVKAGIALRGGVDGQFGAGTSAAVMQFQKSKGLNATGRVDAATAAALAVAAAPAPKAPDVSKVKLAKFPVQAKCYYGDSWQFTRSGGRAHLGVDIMAPAGNELYAVAKGKITKIYKDYPGSLSGNGVRLTMSDGTYFFYAHMSELGPGIGLGVPVSAGQVVGYVGSTGNSGTPHLHFEVHPQGGSAINPYPLVKAIDAC